MNINRNIQKMRGVVCVVKLLKIIGWIIVVVYIVAGIIVFAKANEFFSFEAVGYGVVSGLFLIGLAMIVERLDQINDKLYDLNKKGQKDYLDKFKQTNSSM